MRRSSSLPPDWCFPDRVSSHPDDSDVTYELQKPCESQTTCGARASAFVGGIGGAAVVVFSPEMVFPGEEMFYRAWAPRVTVHGPGLAQFSRDQSQVRNARKLSGRQFVEEKVPVPLHWPVNGHSPRLGGHQGQVGELIKEHEK